MNSLWFLFTEFLKARIVPERIEHGIEPEERGSEREVFRRCRIRWEVVFILGSDPARVYHG